jgi:hypothetical protein
MRKLTWLLLIALAVLAVTAVAASWRQFPLSTACFRPTVLTTADTTLSVPGGYKAIQTIIVNDGTGRCYVNFSDVPINTATDMFVEPNEALPALPTPWSKMHLRAETASANMRILVSY